MNKKPSEYISEFLNFVVEAQAQYKIYFDEVGRQDKLTQDYLHSLELDNLKYDERSKVATRLMMNRKDRRYYKNRVEELESIVQFMEDVQNKKAIDKLTQVLGQTRKIEERQKDRKYKPRILKEQQNG